MTEIAGKPDDEDPLWIFKERLTQTGERAQP